MPNFPTAAMHPLESKLAQSWPPKQWADVTVLVAVSGGPDSVALLRAMAAIKSRFGGDGRLCAAHLNHGLRIEADQDEQFVVELCRQLGLTCEVAHENVANSDAGDGIEAAARSARYRFFEQAAGRLGARFVTVAHTADDQAETILHRIIRGTGIRGLAGMARARPLGYTALVRPLLDFRRKELLDYLEAIGQPYRIDQSNADTRFMRNRIRRDLLPTLVRHYNHETVEALLRLGSLAGQSQAVIDTLSAELFKQCVRIEGSQAIIRLEKLAEHPPHLIRELFAMLWRRLHWPQQAMGMRQWDELCEMAVKMSTTKRFFPGEIVVEIVDAEMQVRKQP